MGSEASPRGALRFTYQVPFREVAESCFEPSFSLTEQALWCLYGARTPEFRERASASTQASNVVTALGFGAWALLALAVAAVCSFGEGRMLGSRRASPYWLVAAGSLVLVAISAGLPNPSSGDSAIGVVAGILGAVGVAVLLVAFGVARSHGLISTNAFPALAAGLLAFVAWQIAQAVAWEIVYSPTGTLTKIRISLTVTEALLAIGYALLAQTALRRMGEAPAHFDPRATAPAPAAWHGATGSWLGTPATPPPWQSVSGQVPPAPPGAYPPHAPGWGPPPSGYGPPSSPPPGSMPPLAPMPPPGTVHRSAQAPNPQTWAAAPPAGAPVPGATPPAPPPGCRSPAAFTGPAASTGPADRP